MGALGQADSEVLAFHLHGAGDSVARRALRQGCGAAARPLRSTAPPRSIDWPSNCGLGTRTNRAGCGRGWRARVGERWSGIGSCGSIFVTAEAAPPSEALDLRRNAATQLMISGNIDEGLGLLEGSAPNGGNNAAELSPGKAFVSLKWHRLLLRLRGIGFRWRDGEIDHFRRAETHRQLLVGGRQPGLGGLRSRIGLPARLLLALGRRTPIGSQGAWPGRSVAGRPSACEAGDARPA